jgi:hypothetical protein
VKGASNETALAKVCIRDIHDRVESGLGGDVTCHALDPHAGDNHLHR